MRYYKDPLEEQADEFLREHCEYFTKKNRKSTMEYPYLSIRQQETRRSTEIPNSSLTNKQKLQCPKMNEPLKFY